MSAGIEYANEAYVWIGQTQITTKLEGDVSLINCSTVLRDSILSLTILYSSYFLICIGISW